MSVVNVGGNAGYEQKTKVKIEAIVLRCQACYFSLTFLFFIHSLTVNFEFCVLHFDPWYVTFMSMEEIIHLVTMISVTNL